MARVEKVFRHMKQPKKNFPAAQLNVKPAKNVRRLELRGDIQAFSLWIVLNFGGEEGLRVRLMLSQGIASLG